MKSIRVRFAPMGAGCALVALLCMTGVAQAGTLKTNWAGLTYTANDATAHEVEATVDGRVLTFVDHSVTEFDRELPSGCTPAVDPLGTGVGAACVLPGAVELKIRLGAGDDWVAASTLPRRVSLDVNVGDGINVVEGGAGDDLIVAGSGGDTLYGGPGSDIIRAGNGFNFVHGNQGADFITTGNEMDFIFGDGGDDVISGGRDLNYIYGGGGDDTLFGGSDADTISGGGGDDALYGGAGDDELQGNKGADTFFAGAGDDLVRARDGEGDTISCGSGNDIARVDAGEVDTARRSCEKVKQADSTPVVPEDEEGVSDASVEAGAALVEANA